MIRRSSARGTSRANSPAPGISVSNNIAEGFERGTNQELIAFLYIARGSSAEVRSMCRLCERLAALKHLAAQLAELGELADNVSRQLRGFAESLQNSEFKGARYVTQAGRAKAAKQAKTAAFVDFLKRVQSGEAKPDEWKWDDAD